MKRVSKKWYKKRGIKKGIKKQHEVNSTKNDQNEVDSKKTKIEEVLPPSTGCSRFLICCKKDAEKKLRGLNKSS